MFEPTSENLEILMWILLAVGFVSAIRCCLDAYRGDIWRDDL